MDKNTIIGALLIGAVLIGFTLFQQSGPQPQATPTTDTTQVVAQSQPTSPATWSGADGCTIDHPGDSASVVGPVLPAYLQERPEQTVVLKNKKLTLKLSNKGGSPVEATLADYTDQQKKPVQLFRQGDATLNLPLRTLENKIVNTSTAYFDVISQSDSAAVLRMQIDSVAYLDFAYTLRPDDYRVGLTITGHELRRLLPVNMTTQDLEWRQRMPQQEQSWKFEGQYSGIYYHFPKGDVERLETSSESTEEIKESLQWVAFKDKYFSSVLINQRTGFQNNTLTLQAEKEGSGYVRSCSLAATFPMSVKEEVTQVPLTFFFGPNDYELLQRYDAELSQNDAPLQLDHLVYLGMSVFRWINKYLIIPIVTFLSGFISNWGIIILLMTLIIKILLYPFTHKSYLSQAKMRVLKPQIDEINAKYPGKDQEAMMKRQTETMNLYRSAGASPMSGCLPMLLQMPFLIALYMYFPTSILLRGQSFLWAQDLSTYDAIISWDFNIPLISSFLGNHLSLFCVLMTVTNVIYTRYTMSQSPSSAEGMAGMKMMPYIMSIMFFFIFNQNASALSYYYFVSTLITILQYLAFRWTLNEEKLLHELEENKKKPRKKSKWMQRLEEAQRLQQEQQRKAQKKGKR
ncbi:membrane protein insertase YidC [uncultured Porphyromonas sp.]|uniref:membrane protein insertase YidC n=1 Tax=uncultured Porphyromonas sp. TaxID=159274 RepID=UPI0026188588|nr:membrane protein insertase YidC [uncultured Porphyromonas sp.]